MIAALANHLLQSTIFAVLAGMLTVFLRNNHARTRYSIWFVASMKFLIPFALFVEIGHRLTWPAAPLIAQPRLALAVTEISQPFASPDFYAAAPPGATIKPSILLSLPLAIWICGCAVVLILWLVRWRRMAATLRASVPIADGRQFSALRRLDPTMGLIASPAMIEPGVFGIVRPVLSMPFGIEEHLNDAQLDAIFAHELCHVRRRDNLTAVLHMVVEAVFWFHPLAWWIGARLVEERERACDEEVLRMGSDPELYAETILQVCRLYLASPLVCAAGIGGLSLAKRIEGIMQNPLLKKLSIGKTVVLASTGSLALIAPIAIGILSTHSTLAQAPAVILPPHQVIAQAAPAAPARGVTGANPRLEFRTATVRPESSGVNGERIVGGPGTSHPDQIVCWGITLRSLLARVYFGQIDGIAGPSWLDSDQWYIVAEVPPGATLAQSYTMLRNLLTDRFHLVLHAETRSFTGYALVDDQNDSGLSEDAKRMRQMLRSSIDPIEQERIFPGAQADTLLPAPRPVPARSTPLAYAAVWLSGMDDEARGLDLASNGRRVIDRTGVPGLYDRFFDIPATILERMRSGTSFIPSLAATYGVKLAEVTNEPIEVLVVDGAEKVPVGN